MDKIFKNQKPLLPKQQITENDNSRLFINQENEALREKSREENRLKASRLNEELIEKQKQKLQKSKITSLMAIYSEEIEIFLNIAYQKKLRFAYSDFRVLELERDLTTLFRRLPLSNELEAFTKLKRKKGLTFQIIESSFLHRRDFPLISLTLTEIKKEFTFMCKNRSETFDGAFSTSTNNEMSGIEFEILVQNRLEKLADGKVQRTQSSNDQGIDLLFEKNHSTIGVQVKRYKTPVGNYAVQEAFTGSKYYGCSEAWVVTNSTFTSSARHLAKTIGVRLIDGAELDTL